MADNTLDDLILNDPEPEKKKSKGILALLALIVLLIIVGAILAKMIFSSSDDVKSESNATKEKTVKTFTDTNSANNSSVDNNSANMALDTKDPDLAPLDDINDTMDVTVQGATIDDGNSNSKSDATKVEKNTDETQSKKKATVSKVEKEINSDDLITKGKVIDGKANSQKREHKKVVHTAKHKTQVKHPKQNYGGHGNVYIQVGSFTKGPESSFITKIRRAGFKFRIKDQNGKRRVYVGPFRSREEAKSLLGTVKSKINPDAFIK